MKRVMSFMMVLVMLTVAGCPKEKRCHPKKEVCETIEPVISLP